MFILASNQFNVIAKVVSVWGLVINLGKAITRFQYWSGKLEIHFNWIFLAQVLEEGNSDNKLSLHYQS